MGISKNQDICIWKISKKGKVAYCILELHML